MTEALRIIPLGGLGEIGKNMTLFEYDHSILIVDAGIMFPEHDMWGIDVVIPDFTYLRENAAQVSAIVITHGHEDHIGALPYLLGDVVPVDTPIYATRLAAGLIEAKLSEFPKLGHPNIKLIAAGEAFRVGPLAVEFLAITHSIPDGVGLALHTPVGRVIHTGDFKFDYTPVRGGGPGFARLGELGAQGVLALLSDSTGAERAGYTPSESVIVPAFDAIFREAAGRVIVATFASQLSRVQQVIDAAHAHGRVVALAGYSMLKTVEIARKLGHLDVPAGALIELSEALRLSDRTRGHRHHRQPGPTRGRAGPHGRRNAPADRDQTRRHGRALLHPHPRQRGGGGAGHQQAVRPRRGGDLSAPGRGACLGPRQPGGAEADAGAHAAALLRAGAWRAPPSARARRAGPPARHREPRTS